jgi:hypothetical protein
MSIPDTGIYSTCSTDPVIWYRSSSLVWVRSVIVRIDPASLLRSEAEFLDVIGTQVLRVFLPATNEFYPPPPLTKQVWNRFAMKIFYTETSVWELSRLCPETSPKLCAHEFGFSTKRDILTRMDTKRSRVKPLKRNIDGWPHSTHVCCQQLIRNRTETVFLNF